MLRAYRVGHISRPTPRFYLAILCIAWTMLSQDVRLSVCPSVRLSHASILSKRLKVSSNSFRRRILDSHVIILVFPHQMVWKYTDWDPCNNGGVECMRGMKKSRFSTNISLYLGNDTRQSHLLCDAIMRVGPKLLQSFRMVPF